MFVPFPREGKCELRNKERKKTGMERRNQRKELTSSNTDNLIMMHRCQYHPAMGVHVILCIYALTLPSCVDLDFAPEVNLIINAADHSVRDLVQEATARA